MRKSRNFSARIDFLHLPLNTNCTNYTNMLFENEKIPTHKLFRTYKLG